VNRIGHIISLKYRPAGSARHGVGRAVLAIFCFLLAVAPLSAGEFLPGPVPATVLRVIDGDSLVVRATIWLGQEVETTVRLLGVDTPELRGKCSEERKLATRSRQLTARLAQQGADITLREIQFGKFAGRVLARVVTAGGVDVGEALIEAGLGREYHGGRRVSWCLRAASGVTPS
jgi:endonuclease YncB( thermonuclease family)